MKIQNMGSKCALNFKKHGESDTFYFIGIQKGGGTINLEPCLTHTSTIEPSLAPMAVERTITTRAAASVCPLLSIINKYFCIHN
jgi:hypothetical protein